MNKNINYIITGNAATFIIMMTDGSISRKTLSRDNILYPKIIEFLSSPDFSEITPESFLEKFEVVHSTPNIEGLDYVNDAYYFDGKLLPKALSDKICSIKERGLPFEAFEAFLGRVMSNPSAISITNLYDFLEYRELPITADGYFLAYKGIDTDGYSVRGNLNTIVNEGTVDSKGRILNTDFGKRVSVDRNQVDDDRTNGCSFGLHVGSFNYARGWGSTLILVKVDPADVVSVPSSDRFQKCRVCAYTPISLMDKPELESPICDEFGNPELSEYDEYREDMDDYTDAVEEYIGDLPFDTSRAYFKDVISEIGGNTLSLKEALNHLGYSWNNAKFAYNTEEIGDLYIEL